MDKPAITESQYNSFAKEDTLSRSLEGVLYYSSVHSPNYSAQRKFNSDPAFIVTLGLDKEEEIEKAKSFGLIVKPANETIPYPNVKVQRKVKGDKTPDDVKPTVVDAMQREIPSHILIGNGSRGILKFGTYWHPNSSRTGVGTALFKVTVSALSPYTASQQEETIEGGFSIDAYLKGEETAIINSSDDLPESDDIDSAPTTGGKKNGKKSSLPPIFDEE